MMLSEMKQVLATGQIQLTKSLGQNFLFDRNQLRRMVDAAQVTAADSVLEIGPGLGPLTELLLARAKAVLAIEKDSRLVQQLRQRFAGVAHLTLVHADAVDYLRQEARDWRQWKLVANLPYSVTSALLTAVLRGEHGPERMTLTVQWEVAQRLMAAAGQADYGVLTLLTQLRYVAGPRFKIPRTCFFPEPTVDSAVMTLQRRAEPWLAHREAGVFERLVRLSFSQRRKMMCKLLKAEWPAEHVTAAFAQVGLAPSIRAEDVTLEQFVQLTRLVAMTNDE